MKTDDRLRQDRQQVAGDGHRSGDAALASGADLLVRSLAESGVDCIFGVPGDTGVALYDALARAGGPVRHVLANDERGAAFMADAYARRLNRLGIVEVSSGGGVTFVVGGLGESFAASVPLLVITSDISVRSRGTGALTEIDQVQLFRAVTKWQAVAESAADIPELCYEAAVMALSGRPAPVVLIIPENVLDEETALVVKPFPIDLPSARPRADRAAVEDLAKGLADARRPAILAGSGIHLSDAYAELAQLVERFGVPVATSIHGKGSISETSKWSLGVAGANGGNPTANSYLASSDCVLLLGTRANATDTNGYTAPSKDCTFVAQVDIDPERAGRNYPGSLKVVGDLKTVLAQVLEASIDAVVDSDAKAQRVEQLGRGRDAIRPVASSDYWVDPVAVVEAIHRCAGSEVPVISDCGTPTPYLASAWVTDLPGRQILLARGHGPMGYAFPGAIGLASAERGKPVIAIVTDGSLLMAVGALETASRMRLPICYVHLRNGTLGWIKAIQDLYYDKRHFATDISNSDAVAIARGFGLEASTVRNAVQLEELLNKAIASGRPIFIDVPVPSEEELIPPVSGWEADRSLSATSRPIY